MDPGFVLWFNAVVYASSLYYLGVSPWKAVVVGVVVLVATDLWYGRKWLLRIGFMLMIVGIAVWIGVLPEPQTWPALAESAWQKF